MLQARKIEEHRRKKERKQLDRQELEKQEKLRKIREAQAKAREQQQQQQASSPADGETPGAGIGGPGAMPQFAQFLNDPEVLQAFQVSNSTQSNRAN